MSKLIAKSSGKIRARDALLGYWWYEKSEADKVIAELEDKCQMHDFFWAGCAFAKRGFKNTIAVSEAFDKLEAETVALKRKNDDYRYTIAVLRKEKSHQKYKRCLAMAMWCASRVVVWTTEGNEKKSDWYWKWKEKWLELAEKFKAAP